MLQTSAIKHDSTAAAQAVKDKDPVAGANAAAQATPSLESEFSSYFSQMMAALPAQPSAGTDLPAPAAAPKPAEPAKKPVQAANANAQGAQASAAPDGSQASALAAAGQAQASNAQASVTSAAPSAGTGPSQAQAATTPAAGTDSKAAANQAKPAVTGTDAQAAGAQAAAAASTPEEAQAQAKALAQAFPGAKLQIQQVGDMASDAIQGSSTRPPLSEFLGQNAVDPKATPQDATLQAPTVVQNLAQAIGQSSAGAGLAGLQAVAGLQTPLLTGAAQPSQGQVAGVQNAASGTTLAGNVASAQMGAAALPGASGAVRVSAPAAAQGALPSAQEEVLSHVDGSIRWLVKNQDKSAEMQLHPESLGRVQIKLTVEGDTVHAKVWASEPAAVPLLQDHKSYLEQSLKQQGLNLGSFDLQQGRRQDQTPPQFAPEPALAVSGVGSAALAGQESPAAASAASTHAGRIEFVA
jgi:Meckel syndrome type 1 protein